MKTRSEFLKSTGLRLGTLFLALAGLGVRYAGNWLFDPPEVVSADVALNDRWSQVRQSASPARRVLGQAASQWKIAVVTNRSLGDSKSIFPVGMTTFRDRANTILRFLPDTSYGFTEVTVPLNRTRGAFCVDAKQPDHVQPDVLQSTDCDAFYADVGRLLESAEVPDVLVFVHGFNVTLEQAAARAAQVAEDMPFHGVMIAYSWASAAQETGYGSDAIVAERHFWNLAEVLAELRNRLPRNARLHVLAHSMGNRVTLRALNALAGTIGPHGEDMVLNPRHTQEQFVHWGAWSPQRLTSPALANLILAAPDVERHEFEHFVSSVRHTTSSMVLYASDSDMALEGSLHYNGEGHRAGDSRAHVRVDGLRVIHVSGVNRLDPLGHSYYGSNPGVLDQLAHLLRPVEVPESVSAFFKTAAVPSKTVLQ